MQTTLSRQASLYLSDPIHVALYYLTPMQSTPLSINHLGQTSTAHVSEKPVALGFLIDLKFRSALFF